MIFRTEFEDDNISLRIALAWGRRFPPTPPPTPPSTPFSAISTNATASNDQLGLTLETAQGLEKLSKLLEILKKEQLMDSPHVLDVSAPLPGYKEWLYGVEEVLTQTTAENEAPDVIA